MRHKFTLTLLSLMVTSLTILSPTMLRLIAGTSTPSKLPLTCSSVAIDCPPCSDVDDVDLVSL